LPTFQREGEIMSTGGYVYIMTNKPMGILYTGVTADLPARVEAHRVGYGSLFCRKWDLKRLVFAEPFDRIADAIAREKAIKRWKRVWKLRLISEQNPHWDDLFERLNG
jgi:putative endonuclease